MATNVKVVGTDLRQVTIKVNPGTYLTDILEQACAKLKVSPEKFLLKHSQRQLDLSQTFRTSGLIQGAKLELIVRSTTPTAIAVALQLPAPESSLFPPSGRVIEKLPSDYTIWQVLRQFESGKASTGKNLNITARGVAQTNNGSSAGSGQLYYETPVVVVNRTLSTFADFQKTLSQLGYNSGNVLMRLSFQKTDKTLSDAMKEISEYFKTDGEDQAQETVAEGRMEDDSTAAPDSVTPTATSTVPEPASASSEADRTDGADESASTPATQAHSATDAMDIDEAVASDHRPVTVFSAPTSNTPAAALRAESEDAFTPDISHAKAHQRLLKTAGENKRLLSDRELEDKAAAEAARVAAVRSIKVKVRFPDNTSAAWNFGPDDTGAMLYSEVRKIMANGTALFKLALPPGKVTIKDKSGPEFTLIKGYSFSSNTSVNFIWDDTVSADVRKQPFLKEAVAGQAKKVEVPDIPEVDVKEEAGPSVVAPTPKPKKDGDGSGFKKPKWLKGLGKK